MANTATGVPAARRSRRGAATASSVADSGAASPRRSRSDGPDRSVGAASQAATSAAMPTANPIQARTHGGWALQATRPAQNAPAAAGSAHVFTR